MPDGSLTIAGSLNASVQLVPTPVDSQTALKKSGGAGLSVFGSTADRAAAGPTVSASADSAKTMIRTERRVSMCEPSCGDAAPARVGAPAGGGGGPAHPEMRRAEP